MTKVRSYLKVFLLAVTAGICIGIGGAVYLALAGTCKIAGAFFFSVGLTAILVFGCSLFTGMVGYIPENKPIYLLKLLVVWVGNLGGTFAAAGLLRLTRLADTLVSVARGLAETKLSDSWYSLLILGVFCGTLMYIAVDTYKKNIAERPALAIFAVIMGVAVFILAGFEHSIADMFYFALSDSFPRAFLPLLWITLGNSLGGCLIPVVKKAACALAKD